MTQRQRDPRTIRPRTHTNTRRTRKETEKNEEKKYSAFLNKLIISSVLVFLVYTSARIDAPFAKAINEKTKVVLGTNTSVETLKETYYEVVQKLDSAKSTVQRINGQQPDTDTDTSNQVDKTEHPQASKPTSGPSPDPNPGITPTRPNETVDVQVEPDTLKEIDATEDIYYDNQKK